ncbi:MAG TPA: hypothetical protein PLZ95_05100 [Bryobacteraceae bacterium]|nr:hypothetical protein [Bryobacteraceae bacterium]
MARRYKPDKMVSGKDLSDYPEFVLQMAIEGDFSLLPEEIARELSSLDQEQRARRLREHFESAERSSEIELRHLLRSHNPLNVLAFLALASHLRIDGKPSAKPTTQIHVELLQFLTLATVPVATVDGPCLHDYSRIGNAIKHFETACILRQSPELDRHLSHEEIRRQRASFVVRQNFALSRTWAYPAHLDTYIGELVQPLDERLRQNSGLSATGLIRFWRGLRDLIQARVSCFHSLRLGRVVEANNLRRTAATLHLSPRLVTAMEAELRHPGCEELNSCVEELFTVSLDDCILVSSDERVTPETMRRYLQRCSLAPGKVDSRPLAEVMVANPIWLAPLLALSDDCYFIALPSLFHSFAFVHLEREFELAGLRRPYESRRARYLAARGNSQPEHVTLEMF